MYFTIVIYFTFSSIVQYGITNKDNNKKKYIGNS